MSRGDTSDFSQDEIEGMESEWIHIGKSDWKPAILLKMRRDGHETSPVDTGESDLKPEDSAPHKRSTLGRWIVLAMVLPFLVAIPLIFSPWFRDTRSHNAEVNVEMIEAIDAGNLARVSALLADGASVNAKTKSGLTALSVATIRGETAIAKLLIERGASLDARDKSGTQATPGNAAIHWAAIYGRTEILKTLLEHGMVPDQRDRNGKTLLMLAAENGHLQTVQFLLERGADPNAKSLMGETPFVCAERSGKSEVKETIQHAILSTH
ncbi:MAG: ankyrin repeat domain-containing protein [Fimbriimonadia bacterium]|nr:ankyrin repeat domain-containing protein [Fimbriimonadia bacterium]